MSLLTGINQIIGLFVDLFKQVSQWRIWLILVGYFLINWLVLYALYHFLSQPFAGIVSAWLSLFDEQSVVGFTHYPGHFLLLPLFFGWTKVWLGLLLEGTVLGSIAVLFAHRLGAGPDFDRRLLYRIFIHSTLTWAILHGLVLLADLQLPVILESFLEYAPRRQMLFNLVLMPSLYVILLAIFFYAIPAAAVLGKNTVRATMKSISVFLKHPLISLFLAASVLFIPFSISTIVGRSGMIAAKFHPELIHSLLLAGILVDIVVLFLWMGTAVKLLLDSE